jgi:hypothetical protein
MSIMNDRERRYAVTVDMERSQFQRIQKAAKLAGQSRAEWMRRAAEAKLARDKQEAA